MGGGEQAAAALRTKLRAFRERGEVPAAVGYGLPTALIVLALLWPFLYGVVPSRAVWKSTSASGAPDNWLWDAKALKNSTLNAKAGFLNLKSKLHLDFTNVPHAVH